ncbi:MAG: hypothetical protein Rubg2KO_30450 [Rubricoccaceae bacterium]
MSIHRPLSLASSVLLLALAMLLSPARAQTGATSSTIAFQGVLLDSGVPVSDGSRPIALGLFYTPTGGSAFYAETHTVTTTGGVFSLPIGGGTATSGLFEIENFRDAIWVEVSVGGAALSPRTALQPAPYALSLRPGAFTQGDVGIRAEGEASTGFVYGLYGAATSSTGNTYGVYGLTESSAGAGVYGLAEASSGLTFGVNGASASTDGRGVYGLASATSGASFGVYGLSQSSSGVGVYGSVPATSGFSTGVSGVSASTSGRGVRGIASAASGTTTGVWGESASISGRGVVGIATLGAGETDGVYGESQSPIGRGVHGVNLQPNAESFGVLGRVQSPLGRGVEGRNGATTGRAVGVYGSSASTSGNGVFGVATATSGFAAGVLGQTASSGGYGVLGQSFATTGSANGVIGFTSSPTGSGAHGVALATSGEAYGVRARTDSPDGYSGYFEKGRGIWVREFGLRLEEAAMLNEGVTVEFEDAVVGLYSKNIGNWGSAVVLGERFGGGALTNKWSMARGTGSTGALHFTFGTSANYSVNDTQMRIDTDGSVHADGSFTGGGADFAEWLPLSAASSIPEPGQLVGVTAGHVGLATDEAEQVMIVSSNPAFIGNPDAEENGALVALVGQAEVRLASSSAGLAQVGDLLVASGRGDGMARAVSPARYDPAVDGPVAGRVIELVNSETAVALVGVDEAAALRDVVVRQQDELATQAREIEALQAARDQHRAQLDALSARLDALAQMSSE